MKTEDRTYYPGRIESQPYTTEKTSVDIDPTNEKKEKLQANEYTAETYAVEDDDHYAG